MYEYYFVLEFFFCIEHFYSFDYPNITDILLERRRDAVHCTVYSMVPGVQILYPRVLVRNRAYKAMYINYLPKIGLYSTVGAVASGNYVYRTNLRQLLFFSYFTLCPKFKY